MPNSNLATFSAQVDCHDFAGAKSHNDGRGDKFKFDIAPTPRNSRKTNTTQRAQMQIFDSEKVYNFMKMRWAFFAISLALFLGSVGYTFIKGLNYGIDFAGGTLIQLKYDRAAPLGDIRERLEKSFDGVTVTEFGSDDEVIIRYLSSTDEIGNDPGAAVAQMLAGTGNFEVRRVDIVGPKVGDELRQKGFMAIAV